MNAVTLGIPTYNRARLLRGTLATLARLTVPRHLRVELLVVNNHCTDETPDVVSEFATRAPFPVRHIAEARPGLGHARNRILGEATGEFAVFFDDDVEVSPLWLEGFARAVEEMKADCVVGPVSPAYEAPLPVYVTPRILDSVTSPYSRKGSRPMLVPDDLAHEIPGCNFGISRCVALELGGFRTDLDRQADSLLAGGDTELGWRLAGARKRVVYQPDCAVKHVISSDKLARCGLRRRWRGIGAAVRRMQPPGAREVPAARRARMWLGAGRLFATAAIRAALGQAPRLRDRARRVEGAGLHDREVRGFPRTMTAPVISVRHISKQYRIGTHRARYRMLRDDLAQALTRPFRQATRRGEEALIWALKDVSLDIRQGEIVGVIGRNGAGKTTLLRILSGITYPTEGRAEIRGRVGSLLEVGTGFHPELTGRENIYLNGAILGMTRAEIRRKFDEIVAFAEVDKFIDTPVKRYSSGMYVRLAFAVAAHLEPEILLVDEVLAVGDAQFQRKCLGKMGEVATAEGRTILFVSHNLAAVQELCRSAIVLDAGRVYRIAPAAEACDAYLRLVSGPGKDRGIVRGGTFEIAGLRVEGDGGRLPAPLEPATFVVPIRFRAPCSDPHVHLFVQTPEGETIFGLGSTELSGRRSWPASREFEIRFRVEHLALLPGPHRLTLKVRSYDLGVDEVLHTDLRFEVAEAPVYGTARVSRRWHGLAAVEASVEVISPPGG